MNLKENFIAHKEIEKWWFVKEVIFNINIIHKNL